MSAQQSFEFTPGTLEERVKTLIDYVNTLDAKPDSSILSLALNWKKMIFLCCELTKLERELFFYDNETLIFLNDQSIPTVHTKDGKQFPLYLSNSSSLSENNPTTMFQKLKNVLNTITSTPQPNLLPPAVDKLVTILQRFEYALTDNEILKTSFKDCIKDIALQIHNCYIKFQDEQEQKFIDPTSGATTTVNNLKTTNCEKLLRNILAVKKEENNEYSIEKVIFKSSDVDEFGDALKSYLNDKNDEFIKTLDWSRPCDQKSLGELYKKISENNFQTNDNVALAQYNLQSDTLLAIVRKFLSFTPLSDGPLVTMNIGNSYFSSSQIQITPQNIKSIIIGSFETKNDNSKKYPLILIQF